MCKLKKNGGGEATSKKNGEGNFNSRYKTYTSKIWKIQCKNNKNYGVDSNLRYKTYTDKIWKIRGKHQENGGWFYSQIQSINRLNIKIEI